MSIVDTDIAPDRIARGFAMRRFLEALRGIRPHEVALTSLNGLDDRRLAEMGIRRRADIHRYVASLF